MLNELTDENCLFWYTKHNDGIEINDTSGKKKLKPNKLSSFVGNSLLNGYEKYNPSDLESIYLLKDVLKCFEYENHNVVGLKIISLRRILLLFMLIPIFKYKDLNFKITYFKSYIFIEFVYELEGKDDNRDKLSYSGFKFEQILTEGDESKGFYCFVKKPLNLKSNNDANLYFTAEIDAIDAFNKPIELKTISKNPSVLLKQRKLISTWCQNDLIDCKFTILGYRSNNFKLNKIEQLSNLRLEQEIKLFDKNECRDCLNGILNQIVTNKPKSTETAIIYDLTYSYNTESFQNNFTFSKSDSKPSFEIQQFINRNS